AAYGFSSADMFARRIPTYCPGSSTVFFFSSRRRHTRCLSDWSSDVCSSDLGIDLTGARLYDGSGLSTGDRLSARQILAVLRRARSEERRVGKEGMLGGALEREKVNLIQRMPRRPLNHGLGQSEAVLCCRHGL